MCVYIYIYIYTPIDIYNNNSNTTDNDKLEVGRLARRRGKSEGTRRPRRRSRGRPI